MAQDSILVLELGPARGSLSGCNPPELVVVTPLVYTCLHLLRTPIQTIPPPRVIPYSRSAAGMTRWLCRCRRNENVRCREHRLMHRTSLHGSIHTRSSISRPPFFPRPATFSPSSLPPNVLSFYFRFSISLEASFCRSLRYSYRPPPFFRLSRYDAPPPPNNFFLNILLSFPPYHYENPTRTIANILIGFNSRGIFRAAFLFPPSSPLIPTFRHV